jgi:cytochrome oxidase assembly protein ShyY1
MIQQTSPTGDGLVRDWPAPDFGIDKHYGYAFQWFALAATLLVFYAATRYRRKSRP